jgi:hypothetical protein
MGVSMDCDLAYAAGIIDGEGSIYSHVNSTKGSVAIRISVSMTDYCVPEWLHDKYGGSLNYRTPSNPRHKPYCQWAISSRQAAALLELLIPYLKAKKEQALIALEINSLTRTRGGSRKGIKGGATKPRGTLVAQTYLSGLLKALKHTDLLHFELRVDGG